MAQLNRFWRHSGPLGVFDTGTLILEDDDEMCDRFGTRLWLLSNLHGVKFMKFTGLPR